MNFLRFLEGIRSPFLNTVFQICTMLGESIPLILLLCLIYWCLDKSLARRTATAFFASGIVLQNLKLFFRVERPWVLDPDFQPVGSAVPGATGYSFPSGHSQSAAAVWGSLACLGNHRKYAFLYLLIPLTVGFSRMYLGCHTPQDVLAGLALGFLGVALSKWLSRRRCSETNVLCLSLLFILICLLSAGYTLLLIHAQTISVENAKDALTIAGSGIGFCAGCCLERRFIHFQIPAQPKKKLARFAGGIILVLLLKLLLGLLCRDSLILRIAEYAVLLLFISAGYPFLFTTFSWGVTC